MSNRNNNISGSCLRDAVKERILVLDGGLGTLIQAHHLTAEDFGGKTGCNDYLVVTRPDIIASIHQRYIDAGADIISTDSFNSNAISLADYGLQDRVEEINFRAARLARRVADMAERKVWVAGSVGPSNKSLSMARSMPGETWGEEAWDTLTETYTRQMEALIRGGVDILLIETQFDLLNTKAALWSAEEAMRRQGRRVEIMVSVTLTENGRMLSGHTPEAFIASVSHANPLSVGFNCGFGADEMYTHLSALRDAPYAISLYPNAGLPDELGCYTDTPEVMAPKIKRLLQTGLVNIIGGCCGTTPEHIRLIAEAAKDFSPREIPAPKDELTLAGLLPLTLDKATGFINVGERCNVAGSRKFLRLIKAGAMDECVDIAAGQIRKGARILDINVDDPMLDAKLTMQDFVNRLESDSLTAEVPLMIDTSSEGVYMAALKSVAGRHIVNSISLKNGEERFLQEAEEIRRLGAVPVVMAFDEEGQAVTFERRIQICQRAYDLLTQRVGFKGYEIIFDPNILAVATGISDHDAYALDYLRTVEWIKAHLPRAKVSGGVSNLSFSFRGNNTVREAMHALFLKHAIKRGMDMAIVNAAALASPTQYPEELTRAIDDVIFNTDGEAADRLLEVATKVKVTETASPATEPEKAQEATLQQLILTGKTAGLPEAVEKALAELGSPIAVIEGPLMEGMSNVGKLFGEGALFLPQVVKAAEVMKAAVAILQPLLSESESHTEARKAGKVVLATVKGDVHDIGKNIVAIVLACNGIEVHDLGVMVPPEKILEVAKTIGADAIGLSGLITPSLDEMRHVAEMMQREGLTIPLFVGGAAASKLHTAVKLAPCYAAPVVYTHDAASLPRVMSQFLSSTSRQEAECQLLEDQERLRSQHTEKSPTLTPIEEARRKAQAFANIPTKPENMDSNDFTLTVSDVEPLINWHALTAAWRVKDSEAEQLLKDAEKELEKLKEEDLKLRARVKFFPAHREGDDIVVADERFPMLRRQQDDFLSMADFINPEGDFIGIFAATCGSDLASKIAEARSEKKEYKTLLLQSLADRLAEAATEWLHREVKATLWPGESIRPAFGYPSLPDQSLVFRAANLIDYESLGIEVTENGALTPSSTTTGFIINNPQAKYFLLGPIGDDQRADYAQRCNIDLKTLSHFLPK